MAQLPCLLIDDSSQLLRIDTHILPAHHVSDRYDYQLQTHLQVKTNMNSVQQHTKIMKWPLATFHANYSGTVKNK